MECSIRGVSTGPGSSPFYVSISYSCHHSSHGYPALSYGDPTPLLTQINLMEETGPEALQVLLRRGARAAIPV